MSEWVNVCIPNTKKDHYIYRANALVPKPGARVLVTFIGKSRIGFVIGTTDNPSIVPDKIKNILEIIDDTPFIDQSLLNLCQFVGEYYQAPLSDVLRLALPKLFRQGAPILPSTILALKLHVPEAEAKAQLAPQAKKAMLLIEHLNKAPISIESLKNAGFTSTIIKNLINKSIASPTQLPVITNQAIKTIENPLTLNDEQKIAVDVIKKELHHYHCFLLDGITGSGKTEVYLQVMETVLLQGRQVLFLVPEIGLTPQLLARFKKRFHVTMAVIHSHLTEKERQSAWTQAHFNEAKLIIGTRTAVFTSMPALGLIVIDEEHDASLKQMEGVRYSARDTALMRAHQANIPIVLGSATPSLESLYNAIQNKYTRLMLHQKAESTHPLHVTISDIRSTSMQQGIAPCTLKRIEAHLNKNQQVLVFINRRGFSPVFMCHQCGWMCDCPACDAHLTFHRQDARMICHHCGLVFKKPRACKNCQSTELVGIGTGTQRLHEFLQTAFPTCSVMRIDRDEVQGKYALAKCLKAIDDGEAQLIVGTQMMAKGHHFPRLTLVVIVDVDNGFHNQDFRAIEKLGQLITQVAGRAGRAALPGEMIIQTHLPEHPLLNLLLQQGYHAFAEALLSTRAMAMLPPVHFMALIRAEDKKEQRVTQFMQAVKDFLDKELKIEGLQILGPAPAPMQRKAHYHRMQVLCKSSKRKILQTALTKLRQWLTMNKMASHVRWHIDVDPIDLS